MTVPIISDSHGRGGRIENIIYDLEKIGERVDNVIFLGDGVRDFLPRVPEGVRAYCVTGNCDGSMSFYAGDLFDNEGEIIPGERIEDICGIRVLMMHGHKYGVKGGEAMAVSRAAAVNADVLLYGHTHIPTYRTVAPGSNGVGALLTKPLHVFNPGSLGEGSFGLLTVKDGKILLSHGKVAQKATDEGTI